MKDNKIYLIHVRDCIARVKEYTLEGKQAFYEDTKTQDAVIRNLEVMSESVKKLPKEWKETHPEILWGKITGFRNILAHEYLSIDLDILWEVVECYLPPLEIAIEAITQKFWNN
ncbi:HepT-like ribonuclease domain-containing protein [Aphanothece sacrum]|uniref:Nucleotidyltransferase n=1 Tax=Aphanothece sacrum FPU1 TaxID=1920663 RepID=A0A401IH52_APHSA|nr:HepT-like ribonuclease domain-containing protein [Aphanothece sacrum]GBF80613.1 nucleotidyltransferase [Aphanothece sacrum FPU1]GBF83997.1 nucleotidyltransferase [Aphanothece sacrum FPU3]